MAAARPVYPPTSYWAWLFFAGWAWRIISTSEVPAHAIFEAYRISDNLEPRPFPEALPAGGEAAWRRDRSCTSRNMITPPAAAAFLVVTARASGLSERSNKARTGASLRGPSVPARPEIRAWAQRRR
jgi:hypothetical protein